MTTELKPDRPCRYAAGDRVHLLDALNRPHKEGKVLSGKWNGDGSDIGWWMRVRTDDGRLHICHEADIRAIEKP